MEEKDSVSNKSCKKYFCGKESFWNLFRRKVYIKDLDGNILYEGKGDFNKVLEKAVKEGVALPKADLRNKDLRGIDLSNGKFPGASFDNSNLGMSLHYRFPLTSSLANSDISGASFKDTKLYLVDFKNANADKANFHNQDLTEYPNNVSNFEKIIHLDKALNVKKENLNEWKKAQEKLRLVTIAKGIGSR